MPDHWAKLLAKGNITKEDYARNSKAVFDVLEFYTEHQKREMEGLGTAAHFAALLEKPQEQPEEKRSSTIPDVQFLEKLQQVVSSDDPSRLYSKIKKVGEKYVSLRRVDVC